MDGREIGLGDGAAKRRVRNLAGLELDESVSKIVGPASKGPIRLGSFGQPLHKRAKPWAVPNRES
jgi:hypothetical protein